MYSQGSVQMVYPKPKALNVTNNTRNICKDSCLNKGYTAMTHSSSQSHQDKQRDHGFFLILFYFVLFC